MLLLYSFTMTGHSNDQKFWFKNLEKVWQWRDEGGPRPTEREFEFAAQWYMRSDHIDYRAEDVKDMVSIPVEMHKYFKSAKEMPRRMRAP